MATKIFVNLPVKDLGMTRRFFTNLGFTFNPHFTDEHATCMIISEGISIMMLTEAFFKNPQCHSGAWLDVWAWFPGSGRPPLGNHVHGS